MDKISKTEVIVKMLPLRVCSVCGNYLLPKDVRAHERCVGTVLIDSAVDTTWMADDGNRQGGNVN